MERGYRPRDAKDLAGKPKENLARHPPGSTRLPPGQPPRHQPASAPSAARPSVIPPITAPSPIPQTAAPSPTPAGATPVQRKAPGGASTPAKVSASQPSTHAEPAISGPLPAGETRTSGSLTVHQVNDKSAVITLGKSRITIDRTGKQDKYCVELERSRHEAIHGGGNMRRGREWPGEWNRMIMERLHEREEVARRKLTTEEILEEARIAMRAYGIDKPFVHYRSNQP